MTKNNPEFKPLFLERMKELLKEEKDFNEYLEILKIQPVRSIRCNKLKISPNELLKKLTAKGWKIKQPWKSNPEVMVVENNLEPGELGRALEHLLGYYYIQELASMLPTISLSPQEDEVILDLCASPGSKTTQTSAEMNNTGVLFANEVSLGRIKILASNLERCGVTNVVITKKDGIALCDKLKNYGMKFDRILVDAPCSGEGTLRSSPRTYLMWNINTIKKLAGVQKSLVVSALEILQEGGTLIYSTCTHAPEENEGVVNFILEKFGDSVKLEKVSLPVKTRQGITEWEGKKFSDEVKKCARIYPQDNNTEGFFVAKIIKIK